MKKKPPSGTRLPVANPGPHNTALNWPNVPEQDLWLYARSFHTAAKKLAGGTSDGRVRLPFTVTHK